MKRGFEENVPKVRPRVRLGRVEEVVDEEVSTPVAPVAMTSAPAPEPEPTPDRDQAAASALLRAEELPAHQTHAPESLSWFRNRPAGTNYFRLLLRLDPMRFFISQTVVPML